MSRIFSVFFLSVGLVGTALAQPAPDAPAPAPAKEDPAQLEKAVSDAPGPVGCWVNNSGDVLEDCETREKGLDAFKRLYAVDKKRAAAALQKRFDEIPSPKGGYFPILAAAQVKDKDFIPMLRKLAAAQKENIMAVWANEAISVIETGKCTRTPPVPRNLRELCM